jgi:hypothetical protein
MAPEAFDSPPQRLRCLRQVPQSTALAIWERVLAKASRQGLLAKASQCRRGGAQPTPLRTPSTLEEQIMFGQARAGLISSGEVSRPGVQACIWSGASLANTKTVCPALLSSSEASAQTKFPSPSGPRRGVTSTPSRIPSTPENQIVFCQARVELISLGEASWPGVQACIWSGTSLANTTTVCPASLSSSEASTQNAGPQLSATADIPKRYGNKRHIMRSATQAGGTLGASAAYTL